MDLALRFTNTSPIGALPQTGYIIIIISAVFLEAVFHSTKKHVYWFALATNGGITYFPADGAKSKGYSTHRIIIRLDV